MEMKNITLDSQIKVEKNASNTPNPNQKTIVWCLIGALVFAVILFVGGYYLFGKKEKQEVVDLASAGISEAEAQNLDKLIAQLGEKNLQIKALQEENSQLKQEASNLPNRLKYVIKPQEKMVAECYSAKVGRFFLPNECKESLVGNVKQLLDSNKKIVALEVSGVVDTQAYRGLSPELKQEGLASFRAKEVIEYLRKSFPNVTTFEGLSVQEAKKRGFFIRAYYVQ